METEYMGSTDVVFIRKILRCNILDCGFLGFINVPVNE